MCIHMGAHSCCPKMMCRFRLYMHTVILQSSITSLHLCALKLYVSLSVCLSQGFLCQDWLCMFDMLIMVVKLPVALFMMFLLKIHGLYHEFWPSLIFRCPLSPVLGVKTNLMRCSIVIFHAFYPLFATISHQIQPLYVNLLQIKHLFSSPQAFIHLLSLNCPISASPCSCSPLTPLNPHPSCSHLLVCPFIKNSNIKLAFLHIIMRKDAH